MAEILVVELQDGTEVCRQPCPSAGTAAKIILAILEKKGHIGGYLHKDGFDLDDDCMVYPGTALYIPAVSYSAYGGFKHPAPAPPITGIVDWNSVVKLSTKQMMFLDKFLELEYPVPQKYSGVTDVPVYRGLPSMLLFDLGRKDFTHASLIQECISSAMDKLQDTVIVAGTSGCGKTRSIYDLLANEYGLYFVMSTDLNGGSNDMSEAVERLRGFLTLNDRTGGNNEVVGVYMMLLLACRIVAFDYCRAKGVTTLKWLLLQVAGRSLHRGCGDVFLDIFMDALGRLPADREGIRSQHESLLRFLHTKRRRFRIVALDEAQIAVQELAESFFPTQRTKWLPLINPLADALKRGGQVLLISGTGHTLRFKEALTETGSGNKMPEIVHFVGFSSFKKPEEMLDFAHKVVRLSPEEVALVCHKFSGRYRPFADVLQVMIHKGMGLAEAAAYVIQGQTTRTGKPEFPKSFYMKVERLSTRRMQHGVSLIDELKSAVIRYFGHGRVWNIAAGNAGVEAIEAGVGLMVTDGYAVEISEYLVLLAARNFFEDEMRKFGKKKLDFLASELFKLLFQLPYSSAQGLVHQKYVVAKVEAMWKRCSGRMASMPLFKPLLQAPGCPAKFTKLAKLEGRLKEGLWSIMVNSNNRYPLLQYLSDLSENRQLCTSYICEEKYGADAVRVAEFLEDGESEGETSLVHISDHYKLWTNPLSEAEMAGFVHEDVLSKLSTIRLQLVFIRPQVRNPKWRWPAAFWKENVGFVIVDNNNAGEIFGEEASAYIDLLKDGVMYLEKRTENNCEELESASSAGRSKRNWNRWKIWKMSIGSSVGAQQGSLAKTFRCSGPQL